MATVIIIHARALVNQAKRYARTHRGETPLQFHLSMWAEEASEYSRRDNDLMLEAARRLIVEGGE